LEKLSCGRTDVRTDRQSFQTPSNVIRWTWRSRPKKHTFTNQKKRTTTQNKQKNKAGLVALYDILPGNRAGLFSQEKISKGVDKKGNNWSK